VSGADPLLSGSRWNFQFCTAVPLYVIVRRRGERTYRAVSSWRRRRAAITATPLKMAFIKAILPGDRCRAKGKSESRSQRRWGPLPLADPLRMIITSRRLNFAPHPPYPDSILLTLEGVQRRTASFHRHLPHRPPLLSPSRGGGRGLRTILNDLLVNLPRTLGPN